MHFDHIDESYAMVKSNLHFDKVTLTDLTVLPGVLNFPKPYLSHTKFKSNIPHMPFDRLDEIYAMVKSLLPFEQHD